MNLKSHPTFKWNNLYSMNILKLMYNERIKIFWTNLKTKLKCNGSGVYDIQRYFQFKPWNIEEEKIEQELIKMKTI